MKKFHPSSAAFMLGDVVMTKYDSGCLRSILIKSHKIKTGEIPAIYKRVGAVHEDAYYAELQLDEKNETIQREAVLKRPISSGVDYSGRVDFVVHRAGFADPIIHETKGTISKNTRRDTRKGIYNITYLAQIVSYMVKYRTPRGRLVCGYYEEDAEGNLQRQEQRAYKITIADTGRIEVDGAPSGFNVADLLEHERAAAAAIANDTIGPRPDKWNQKYGGPCTSCAFARTCTLYDEGALPSAEHFLASARQDAETARATVKPEPVPHKVKIKVSKPVKKRKKAHGKSDDKSEEVQ